MLKEALHFYFYYHSNFVFIERNDVVSVVNSSSVCLELLLESVHQHQDVCAFYPSGFSGSRLDSALKLEHSK